MKKINNFIGQKFGRLTITNFICYGKDPKAQYVCDCGNKGHAFFYNIKRGMTVSCGCRLKETWQLKYKHGYAETPTYTSWEAMINRCNPKSKQSNKNPQYKKIKICNSWKNFEIFLKDMGERPENTSLDRIDNLKGYYKENCRWATRKQQSNNIRNNIIINFERKTQTLSEWVREKSLKYTTTFNRYKRGLPLEIVFSSEKFKKNYFKGLGL